MIRPGSAPQLRVLIELGILPVSVIPVFLPHLWASSCDLGLGLKIWIFPTGFLWTARPDSSLILRSTGLKLKTLILPKLASVVFFAAFLAPCWSVPRNSTWVLFVSSRRTTFMFWARRDSVGIWVDLAIERFPLFLPRTELGLTRRGRWHCSSFPSCNSPPAFLKHFQSGPWRTVQLRKRCKMVPPCLFQAERCVLVLRLAVGCRFTPQNSFLLQIYPEIAFFSFSTQKPKIYQSMQVLGIFPYKTYTKR